MTQKIDTFLTTQTLPTPCLVVDLDMISENYRAISQALPLASIHYAVKANPAAPVLGRLVEVGSSFDAASLTEIEDCLAAGAAVDAISYGNTIKKSVDIAKAFELGVRLFAFDSMEELQKLATVAPGAKVYCRILTENEGADWPLSRKFGCELDMARDLMLEARDLGLDAHGISFHVGSQQTDPAQWDVAIGRAAMVFTDLRNQGVELSLLNLGGGMPVKYRRDVPDVRTCADAIMESVTRHFGNALPELMIEPGRSMVADAGILQTEVVLVSRKGYGDDERWVYLDVGKFGGLTETLNEAIEYDFRTDHDGAAMGPVVIAGPTCDGEDVLYEHAGYQLPLALAAGDRVRILSAGAYTAAYASQGFNGFRPMDEYYL